MRQYRDGVKMSNSQYVYKDPSGEQEIVAASSGVPVAIKQYSGSTSNAFAIRDSTDTNKIVVDQNLNVGIGTASPQAKLDVEPGAGGCIALAQSGAVGDQNSLQVTAGRGQFGYNGSRGQAVVQGGSGKGIDFNVNNNTFGSGTAMSISSQPSYAGCVGIGVPSPTHLLQLSGDDALKASTNTWSILSDARIKKNVRPYKDGMNVIRRIRPVWFQHNGKAGAIADGQDHIGVLAQEIAKVAPYTVGKHMAKLSPNDAKETELLSFNSHALTFALINAVKELEEEIKDLKQDMTKMKKASKRKK